MSSLTGFPPSLHRLAELHGTHYVRLKTIRQSIMEHAITWNITFEEGILASIFTTLSDADGRNGFEPIFQGLADPCLKGWMMLEILASPATATPLAYTIIVRNCLRGATEI